jgi:xylulokinase
MSAYVLAQDLGTSGTKASLYDERGSLVAATSATYATHYGAAGHVEHDPDAWWAAVAGSTRALLERSGVAPGDIAGIVLSGMMMSALLVDEALEPVRPAIIWADTRAQQQARALIDRVGLAHAYAVTGHRLSANYTLEKVMWVRDHEPDAFARARWVLQTKDFVAARLCGAIATDPSDASGTNAFDLSTGDWSAELLAAAGIEERLFPPVLPSATVVGRVSDAAARSTGLRAGTPVVLGGGDGSCTALGAGLVEPGSGANTYLGTSAWVSVVTERPLLDPRMRSMTFAHVIPGMSVPTATMQSGGASLDWAAETLASAGPDAHAALVDAAADARAAEDGLFFLPYLLGERSPWWNPHVRGAFVGLARHHGPAHLARAVLEGVAFNLRTCLGAFEEMGVAVAMIDAIGGGARSDAWLRILADVWGRRVRRRSLVDEASSLGAAVVGGVALGLYPGFDVAPTLTEVSLILEPDAERHASYAQAHARFVDAYLRLEPWFGDG